jgi:23S rRNA (uridine2552-2'-O)-methyltransferase
MSRYERKDRFYDRAKAGGYRARSAFKLQELDDRFHLLRVGARVVDLGAWPGGWLQVAAERIGSGGRAVGLDLVAIAPLGLPQVATVQGDIRAADALAAVVRELGGKADVALCDIAPKLSGVRASDESRQADLLASVVGALPGLLAPGGNLLMKVFMNAAYQDTLKLLRGAFGRVVSTRPEATRAGSAELYVYAATYSQQPTSAC